MRLHMLKFYRVIFWLLQQLLVIMAVSCFLAVGYYIWTDHAWLAFRFTGLLTVITIIALWVRNLASDAYWVWRHLWVQTLNKDQQYREFVKIQRRHGRNPDGSWIKP